MARKGRVLAGERRQRRHLASDRRTARFARATVRSRQWLFLRSHRWILALIVVLVPMAFVPLALLSEGVLRGGIIGASVATGLWLAALTVVVFSGVAARFAGATAEEWTAAELRRLRRKGWRLANGLKVRGDYDIDHVLVGPGGVVVVETK